MSYQEDVGDQYGGAEADKAEVDAFAEKVGLTAGMVALAALAAGPAGAPIAAIAGAISAGSGLYQLHRGVETGDPDRFAQGWLNSIPLLGGVSRAGRVSTALRAAARGGANTAYEAAASGGKHAGTLRNYAGRSTAEIQKAISSHERQVALHQQKIANPAQFAERWGHMTAKEQEGLIRHWQQDAARNQQLADVLRGLLESR